MRVRRGSALKPDGIGEKRCFGQSWPCYLCSGFSFRSGPERERSCPGALGRWREGTASHADRQAIRTRIALAFHGYEALDGGMLVGQIAKIQGCRSVGLSASSTSCDWLVDDLGFDAALRRGTAAELEAGLDRHCPGGIDVYFDNIGGTTTDAVIARLNKRARISICGQASQENLPEPELGPRWLGRIAARQARIEGFAVSTCVDRFPEAFARLYEWLHQGQLKYGEEVSVGLESAPQAFIAMLEGRNQGKQLVQLR
jgi:D-arabinose 1-dehydrogenase-like Zn-dependent alcohol dehydrogenase